MSHKFNFVTFDVIKKKKTMTFTTAMKEDLMKLQPSLASKSIMESAQVYK